MMSSDSQLFLRVTFCALRMLSVRSKAADLRLAKCPVFRTHRMVPNRNRQGRRRTVCQIPAEPGMARENLVLVTAAGRSSRPASVERIRQLGIACNPTREVKRTDTVGRASREKTTYQNVYASRMALCTWSCTHGHTRGIQFCIVAILKPGLRR